MNNLYRIVIIGVDSSSSVQQVKARLSTLLKATPEQIELILKQDDYVLRRGLAADESEKYRIALENAGAKIRVEIEQPALESLDVDLPVEIPSEKIRTGVVAVDSKQVAVEKSTDAICDLKSSKAAHPDRMKLADTAIHPSVEIKRGLVKVVVIISVLLTVYFALILIGGGSISFLNVFSRTSGDGLYRFWKVSNPQSPGVYSDELVDARLIYECKAEGKYPAKFGVLSIKTTFDQFALKDQTPFQVYIGGIDYGDKILAFGAQPPETGGAGIIMRLKLAGCEVPSDIAARAKEAQRSLRGAEKLSSPPNAEKQSNDLSVYLGPISGAYKFQCVNQVQLLINEDSVSVAQASDFIRLDEVEVRVAYFGNSNPPTDFEFSISGLNPKTGEYLTLLVWEGARGGVAISVGDDVDAPRLSRCE